MRAATRGTDGPAVSQVPDPVPAAGQVRIRVAAAAVNPVDLATQHGFFGDRAAAGLGWDVAGTIDAVGTGVDALAPGEAVFGFRDRLSAATGSHAELVVLDATAVAPAAGLDPLRAAAVPLNATTGWQGLDRLDLPAGDTLLVTGAAGAVGRFTSTLARRRGLRVVAAVRPGSTDRAPAGADHVVETSAGWPDAVRALVPGGVDGVLDAAGLDAPALDALRPGGRYLSVQPALPLPVALRGTHTTALSAYSDRAVLAELAKLATVGELELPAVEEFPLAEIAAAYARAAQPGRTAAVVLVP
ncbi:NADPH:quinone reductase [Actinocatenispora thailandica]|uniref:NADPH:quinone reductase n=1 Tax=Actinocatenispora thailandica TaxID=227318 RepID=A0A7R7DS09_9ACTN|nr:NADP-dependent oxidoreductase [Actinocatenispora thailandica]BCJ36764.1 NADPH:quinone reductase [Actinocatenispora thailandica]